MKSLFKKNKIAYFSEGGVPEIETLSDKDFLDLIYKKLLGRAPDPEGLAVQLEFLQKGNSRVSLLLNIIEAPEFIHKTVKANIHSFLKIIPIKEERPDLYEVRSDLSGLGEASVIRIKDAADFDWLERKILENRYYDHPGVWSFIIDEDKKMMAEIAAEFKPKAVLDFGCGNGAVLKCLKDAGIHGEGVEISRLALDMAPSVEIREAIHFGDLLTLSLPRRYEVILGLDIFEHLNPNKLSGYLERLHGALEDSGILFANIPAFGKDDVFGEIFKIEFGDWKEDQALGRCFRTIPVDEYGYPKNGHIICADTEWWVSQFRQQGFVRMVEIERAFHERLDAAMERISPARKAFYIFSKRLP